MNEINEQLKDSTFNFENLDLEYFKHYYIELKNQIELFNGFPNDHRHLLPPPHTNPGKAR